jgi:hypothetical protein
MYLLEKLIRKITKSIFKTDLVIAIIANAKMNSAVAQSLLSIILG